MTHVLVTGSTTGVGKAAADELVSLGHRVVYHARNLERATSLRDGSEVVIGDLAEPVQVLDLAEQINRLGPFDVVVHNAGIDGTPTRSPNSLDQPAVLAVNLLAPFVLTALVDRPSCLVYVSSDMHEGGHASLDDLRWTERRWNGTQAYSDSKLFLTTLAFALARRWPDVRSHAVDPGWIPTRMGGPSATDDLELGHRTQVWLAVGDDPEARASGRYWYHGREQAAHPAASDLRFQDALLERLAAETGVALP